MDCYPALRAALADTTHRHFHALRLIGAQPDPRAIAAESVAAAAAAVLQLPALWTAAEIAAAVQAEPKRAARLIRSINLTSPDIDRLLNRLDALDRTARAWTLEAWK